MLNCEFYVLEYTNISSQENLHDPISPVPSKQRRYLKPEVTSLRMAEIIQGVGGSDLDGSEPTQSND